MAISKPSLSDAKMLVICMSVSWVVLEWYLSHDFIVGNKNLSSCKSVYYVLYKCCFLLFSQVTYQYKNAERYSEAPYHSSLPLQYPK